MKDNIRLTTREIMNDADALGAIFGKLQNYLTNNLVKKQNGDYLCVGQSASDHGYPWIMTKAFCRNMGLDFQVFIDYLTVYLEFRPMCEADFVNFIGVTSENVQRGFWYFQDVLPLYKRIIEIECEEISG